MNLKETKEAIKKQDEDFKYQMSEHGYEQCFLEYIHSDFEYHAKHAIPELLEICSELIEEVEDCRHTIVGYEKILYPEQRR